MTVYRSVGDGYCRWLQYRKYINFYFFKVYYWENVPSDHWDEWMHKGISGLKKDLYVCSYNFDLDIFVKMFPNINTWLMLRADNLRAKRQILNKKCSEREAVNSGITKY